MCFDENGKFLRTYEISLDINASDSYKVNCIQNIDGDIWIGAGSNLLSRLDERTEAIDNYSGSAFNFGAVHCLLKYTDKELLVGTDNGLYPVSYTHLGRTCASNPFGKAIYSPV